MNIKKESIQSVQQLLDYFKQTDKPLFYLGRMYCNSKLRMHDFMPNYEIITCCDPFKNRFPFIKVPDSIKNAQKPHKCKDITECLLILLKDDEVIKYIKGKDQHANIILVHVDPQSERICKENSFKIWGPTTQIQNWLNNKVQIIRLLKQANIPFIPNICQKIKSYQHLLELATSFNTKKIVVQAQDGGSGFGTYFIFSKDDYQKVSHQLEDNQPKKIMPFKKLKSFGIGVVTGKFGTALGPLHTQLIGHKKLTPNLGGFCGNQLRKDYFQDQKVQRNVRHQIYQIAERFGDYLYQKNIYKGYFGIDFVVDIETKQPFFMEINPRQTASTTLSYQYYHAQGQYFPLFLFSCAEHLKLDLRLNIKAFNKYWQDPSSYEPAAFHIPFKHLNEGQMDHISQAPSGIWIIQEGKLKYTEKFTFMISEMSEDEIFFIPTQGFAKGHLIIKKKCLKYNGQLNEQMQEIVGKFIELIQKTNKLI